MELLVGNPWVLATLTVAEVYYQMAVEMKKQGSASEVSNLIKIGDSFVQRVQHHSHPDGRLNEQIHRDTGYMTSVENLTWGYASFLSAIAARNQAL